MTLTLLLRTARERAGLSLTDVCSQLGASRQTIWRMETGRAATVERLARVPAVYQLTDDEAREFPGLFLQAHAEA